MPKTSKLVLAAAVPLLLLAGCTDFLKGPGLSTNPNKPTLASPNQLWIGIEVAVMAQYENYPLMLFMTWAQQIAGVNRQWQTYASYNGGTDQTAANGAWDQTYGPGGLRDIKQLDDSLNAMGAIQWRGENRILEALYMGTAADIWGDVPYSNALTPQPTFDTQAVVYAHVLALLDSAITDLTSTDGIVPQADFFYNSNPALWTALAHTLKARYTMHTARTAANTYSAGALTTIIAEAGAGISSTANDFQPSHTSSPGEQNLFYSFQFSRAGDIQPAAEHINQTKQAGEAALLPNWYTPSVGTTGIYGSTAGLPGDAPDGIAAESVSIFAITNAPATSYAFVSYAENQMLLAEATYLNGNPAGALVILNNYRIAQGQLAVSPAPVGVAIREDIIREKFIRSFFSIEVWDDYLRTCWPNIPQPQGVNVSASYVPARLPVGQTEQAANPNVPVQPQGNPPNANNFKMLTTVDGVTACIGQVGQP